MVLLVTEVTVKLGHYKDLMASSQKVAAYVQEQYPGYISFTENYVDTAEFNKLVHVEGYESLAKMEEFVAKTRNDEEHSTMYRDLLDHLEVYTTKTRILVQQ